MRRRHGTVAEAWVLYLERDPVQEELRLRGRLTVNGFR